MRVMLVDDNRNRVAILEQALQDAGYKVVARLVTGAPLLEEVRAVQPDIVIIDMESPDRDILESMRSISRDAPRPIVMFAERSDSDTIQAAVRAGVSAYVVDGLTDKRIRPIMEVAIARFREYEALRRELEQTRNQLADRKVVEQAKGLLMKRRGMDEEEAYQSLRKMAMDRNQRIAEVARNLIAMADLLG